MKKILFLGMIVVGLLLAGCSREQSPKDVAEKFLKAVSSKKYHEAKQLSTKRTGKLLDIMKNMAKIAPHKKQKDDYEVLDYSIIGNKATVQYKKRGAQDIEILTLVKSGERWLVGAETHLEKEQASTN